MFSKRRLTKTIVFESQTELFSTMPGSRKPLCSRTGRVQPELLAFYSLQTYRSHLTKKYVEQWLVQNWIGPRRCSWRCQLLWISKSWYSYIKSQKAKSIRYTVCTSMCLYCFDVPCASASESGVLKSRGLSLKLKTFYRIFSVTRPLL